MKQSNKQQTELKLHQLAQFVPPMSSAEIDDLIQDVKANGLRDPITLDHTGKLIVDGRHREIACKTAKVKPKFVRLPKNVDVAKFILSRLTHRNLTTGQRAMIAADLMPDLSKLTKGARDVAAKKMNVSSGSVQAAKKLKKENPEKADAVRKGKLKLHTATAKKDKPKKATPKKNLTMAQRDADMNRQLAAKGLPLLGEDPDKSDEDDHDSADREPTRTTAPTQRVRSWLSSVNRCLSETTALVGLAEDSELSDEEQEAVNHAVRELEIALLSLVVEVEVAS